jgi:hypothetical protein
MSEPITQPREHPVMCYMCGLDSRQRPRTMTMNSSGLCNLHDRFPPGRRLTPGS